MSNAPTHKPDDSEPSAESLEEMPEIDFSKAKRIIRRGKERVPLYVLRKVHELTQEQLAEKAGLTLEEVKRLEAGEDVARLRRYAEALGGKLEIAIGDRRYPIWA